MRQLLRSAVMIFVLVPSLSTLLHAGVVTFDFDADAGGTASPFTDTVSGLSATFSSPGDPGGFLVASTFFQSLTGNVLFDPGPAGLNDLTLTILFGAPQLSISMNFGTNSVGGIPLNLSAFNGVASVGISSASGSVPAGFDFPEGVLTFSGGTFDRVVLSSAAFDFVIDNVTVDNVTVSNVPEPGSLLLCAVALGALSLVRLRRRIS